MVKTRKIQAINICLKGKETFRKLSIIGTSLYEHHVLYELL